MNNTLHLVWPHIRVDPGLIRASLEEHKTAHACLEKDPDLWGLEIQIWRQADGTAILSNMISWIDLTPDGQSCRFRPGEKLSAEEMQAIVECTRPGNMLSGLAKDLPHKTPEKDGTPHWISCILTREGILLHNNAVRRVGRDDNAWKATLDKEVALSREDLLEISRNGMALIFGSLVATLITPMQEPCSAHQKLRRHQEVRLLLSQHIARVSTMIRQSRRLSLHPDWTAFPRAETRLS